MFGTLFANLRGENNNEPNITRRRYSRRYCDKCVAVVGDKIYPVENWSMGGLMIIGDSRDFGVDDKITVNIKFKTSDDIVMVQHKARVVRKTSKKIALELDPISNKTKTSFQTVIDDFVATRFADPKMA